MHPHSDTSVIQCFLVREADDEFTACRSLRPPFPPVVGLDGGSKGFSLRGLGA
jgi:hypothetical protein